MIDSATIQRIKDAANIVEVVSEFVSLRKRGANYIGLCPFHNERTPSFSVSPARGICKCFSCGETANSVSFLMKHEQMSYPEALRWLANKYNIEIKEHELSDKEKEEQKDREAMFIVNKWAADYFHDVLQNDVDGRAVGMQYFRSRGFRDDIIEKFKLGYSLPQRDSLAKAALAKGYSEKYLVLTGLCFKRDNGELTDRYSGRVIFPWFGVNGNITAFGGRLLDSRTKGVKQKYVNSPDSEIYHKEKELYGLFQAKKAIARENCVYMVEGYTDVISMHQCGIENVVANSGTALSIHQTKTLHRFTNNIVLLYDGDEAGIKAIMKGVDMFLAEAMNVKVLLLPNGDDPDSFARKNTAEDFRKYIQEHQQDVVAFKIDRLLIGVTDPVKRSEGINSIVKTISVVKDTILRATYLKDAAYRIGISEATLNNKMNDLIRSTQNAPQRSETPAPEAPAATEQAKVQSQAPVVETMLIQEVIRHGEEILYDNVETTDGQIISLNVAQYVSYDLGTDELTFATPLYNRILQEAVEHSADAGFKAEDFFLKHPDMEISNTATELSADKVQLYSGANLHTGQDALREQVRHLILDFRMHYVKERLEVLRQKIKDSSLDGDRMMKLLKEYQEMQTNLNTIAKELGNEILV